MFRYEKIDYYSHLEPVIPAEALGKVLADVVAQNGRMIDANIRLLDSITNPALAADLLKALDSADQSSPGKAAPQC